ncbi:LOW QUALITY PROTEIN: ankyrin repeat domain-containing protein SOWAHC [Nilaparvata lugens]|uniref:LOW QUALITY PROTEIN: ankyrin repeat domain-containing protein SOWAHC n=1 Tax=Nilaparvata lugens TaxID=108931 RepID=UPI00193DE4DD|nr:LOW QUALITY PROTEIN: ankyrin repeat domain-containing protein SOWAHC [Nilaparvata lugens]
MGSRQDLSLESIREFILQRGGTVTNHDLVKHFKPALTNPETRAEARNEFKENVNTLATIVRGEEGEKYLILKKRFRHPETFTPGGSSSRSSVVSSPPPYTPDPPFLGIPTSPLPTPSNFSPGNYPLGTPSNFSASQDSFENFFTPTNRQPPPYRPPPPPVSTPQRGGSSSQIPTSHTNLTSQNLNSFPQSLSSSNSSSFPHSPPANFSFPHSPQSSIPRSPSAPLVSRSASVASLSPSTSSTASFSSSTYQLSSSSSFADPPPPVPPRRKSSEKIKMDTFNNNNVNNKENVVGELNKRPKTIGAEAESEDNSQVDAESKITVKECMQKFNRLASESALQRSQFPSNKKKSGKETPERDEEDSVSLDPKAREWQVRAAQCNYQALAKMAGENHRLARLKCPFTTALHWAAKHGNEDVVKLLAGTYKVEVNAVTNGGYTPLHLAMQFGHEEIYNLLVQVYGADPNLRDHSGRKPRQYQTNKDTAVSADTFRKIKARKKHAEKDLGFLRIGSLNVRVKRTTEAFSNFLGVGATNMEKMHKTWGSADNIPLEDNMKMPPPKFAPIKKRKSRRGTADFAARPLGSATSREELAASADSCSDVISSHVLAEEEEEVKARSAGEEGEEDRMRRRRRRSRSGEGGNDSDSDTAAGFGSNWQTTV